MGTRVRVAFLYPGQGAQRPGMLHDLPRHPAVAGTLAEAERVLPGSSRRDGAEELASTVGAQVALCVAGVAATRALAAEGATPDVVAGHSAGGFPAAVAAGVLTFPEALRAVHHRATLMRDAHPTGYGMTAVLGPTVPQVRRLIAAVSTAADPLYLAVVDSGHQTVVTGTLGALARLTRAAPGYGAHRVQRLPIPVPSHCPLLTPVATAMATHLASVPHRPLTTPFIANSTARVLTTPGAVLHDLAWGVATTLRWHDATALLGELGITLFLQSPPGHVLTHLLPSSRTVALADTPLRDAALAVRRARDANPWHGRGHP
ncbi:acyltransferase domain-containing protein [Sphaerisporangium sp. B11E5]|uniref:ACP S-malonyltransferase n=1 Tax=Sphaerisporangium sp. B11E5 TaxID=3153563 RepID=UPI00325D71A4